jgi:hypothetical protein
MRIKITDGGKFAHPDPPRGNQILHVSTGEIVEVDDQQGQMIINLGRAEKVADIAQKVTEVVGPTELETPPQVETEAPQVLTSAALEPEEEPSEEQPRRRGRPPGSKNKRKRS